MRLLCWNCTTPDDQDSGRVFRREVRSAAPSPSQSPPALSGLPQVHITPATPLSPPNLTPDRGLSPDTDSAVVIPPDTEPAPSRTSLSTSGRRPPFIRIASASQSNPNPSVTSFFRSRSAIPPTLPSSDTDNASSIPSSARSPDLSATGRPRSTFSQRLSGFFDPYKFKYLPGSHTSHGKAGKQAEVEVDQIGAGTVYLSSPHRDLPIDPFASRIDMADSEDLGPLCLLPRNSEDSRYTGVEAESEVLSEAEGGPEKASVDGTQKAPLKITPAPTPSPTTTAPSNPSPPIAQYAKPIITGEPISTKSRSSGEHCSSRSARRSKEIERVEMVERSFGQGVGMRAAPAVMV
ncbi:hypothetical protein IAR50_006370 [Cryptococcus sp. DSM 104548]